MNTKKKTANIAKPPAPIEWPARSAYYEPASWERVAWEGPTNAALGRYTGVEIECLLDGLAETLAESERVRSARCSECGAEEDACEHTMTEAATPLTEATRRVFGRWRVGASGDGSLGDDGLEIQAAPARGAAFGRQVGALTYALQRYEDARVDSSCGLHVHVDATDLHGEDIAWLVQAWRAVQPAVMLTVPIERRRRGYCQPTRLFPPLALLLQRRRGEARAATNVFTYRQPEDSSAVEYPDCPDFWRNAWRIIEACRASWRTALLVDEKRRARPYDGARYYALNLHSLHVHGTVEFRLAAGTLQAEKIIRWAMLWNALITWSFHRRAVARAVERLHAAYREAKDPRAVIDAGTLVAARTLYHDVPSRLSWRFRATIRTFLRERWEKCSWGWWCDLQDKVLEGGGD